MNRLIYIIGKSSTGKDTIYRRLMQSGIASLQKVVTYTTRPIRVNEKQGREYHFTDEQGYYELQNAGKIIEARQYNTCFGPWKYFTVDDGTIDFDQHSYLVIGTLESYNKTVEYFGSEKVAPVLIDLEDGVRLQRALDREKSQEEPKYQELCRRFLADSEDFSEEKIAEAGITRRFFNNDLESCLCEIKRYIIEAVE